MIDLINETTILNILLIDDHPFFVDGLKHVLTRLRQDVEVEVALDFNTAIERLEESADYDIVLLDMGLPDIDGYSAIQTIRQSFPLQPLVILSANEEKDLINHAISSGVQGYIPKSTSSEIMISALNLVLSGGIYIPKVALSAMERPYVKSVEANVLQQNFNGIDELLTQRQITILSNLANGLSNKEIARKLNIASGTVRVHMSAIYRVLGVGNRTQAVIKVAKLGS